jgi:hypothetical protein
MGVSQRHSDALALDQQSDLVVDSDGIINFLALFGTDIRREFREDNRGIKDIVSQGLKEWHDKGGFTRLFGQNTWPQLFHAGGERANFLRERHQFLRKWGVYRGFVFERKNVKE